MRFPPKCTMYPSMHPGSERPKSGGRAVLLPRPLGRPQGPACLCQVPGAWLLGAACGQSSLDSHWSSCGLLASQAVVVPQSQPQNGCAFFESKHIWRNVVAAVAGSTRGQMLPVALKCLKWLLRGHAALRGGPGRAMVLHLSVRDGRVCFGVRAANQLCLGGRRAPHCLPAGPGHILPWLAFQFSCLLQPQHLPSTHREYVCSLHMQK